MGETSTQLLAVTAMLLQTKKGEGQINNIWGSYLVSGPQSCKFAKPMPGTTYSKYFAEWITVFTNTNILTLNNETYSECIS